jgi:hypothetical protein
MIYQQILDIDTQELLSRVSHFTVEYRKFAALQQRFKNFDSASRQEQKQLLVDYRIYLEEIARTVENERQRVLRHHSYNRPYQEIKRFYESVKPE